MKRIKTILSVITAAVALSVCALPASAAVTNLLVLGDSIASGYGLSDADSQSYGAGLAREGELSGLGYLNLAADGATSADLLAQIKKDDVATRIGMYDTIIISIGGNDLLSPFFALAKQALGLDANAHNTEIIGAVGVNLYAAAAEVVDLLLKPDVLEQFGVTIPNQFKSNLSEIVAELKNINGDANICIQTIYNPFSISDEPFMEAFPGLVVFSAVCEPVFEEMNAVITEGALEGGYEVIDVYGAFDQKALLYTNITGWDIHPNAAGHDVIRELYADRLDFGVSSATGSVKSGIGDAAVFGAIVLAAAGGAAVCRKGARA